MTQTATRLELTFSIDIAAPPAAVFDALTDPESITAYFPYQSVTSDGRLGGAFICKGNQGDQPFTDYGTITRWEPGVAFGYRYWSDNHGTPRTDENHLTITYFLSPAPAGTQVTVVQGNVPAGPYAETMKRAWPYLLGTLRDWLES